MSTIRNILQNITILPKFEPKSPKKIYHINCLTPYNTVTELIQLVSQASVFVIETKYDDMNGCPKLIQILFAHKCIYYIILVETLYLPSHDDSYLFYQIASLFSTILSPYNEIRSWKDLKSQLKYFLDCGLFSLHQIEEITVINVEHQFQEWFKKHFVNIELASVPTNTWTLEMSIAFLFQEYFSSHLSNSMDWNIGLFAQFDTDCDEKFMYSSDPWIFNTLKDNKRRSVLTKYAIEECFAVDQIGEMLQNNWTRKNLENYLKKFYNDF